MGVFENEKNPCLGEGEGDTPQSVPRPSSDTSLPREVVVFTIRNNLLGKIDLCSSSNCACPKESVEEAVKNFCEGLQMIARSREQMCPFTYTNLVKSNNSNGPVFFQWFEYEEDEDSSVPLRSNESTSSTSIVQFWLEKNCSNLLNKNEGAVINPATGSESVHGVESVGQKASCLERGTKVAAPPPEELNIATAQSYDHGIMPTPKDVPELEGYAGVVGIQNPEEGRRIIETASTTSQVSSHIHTKEIPEGVTSTSQVNITSEISLTKNAGVGIDSGTIESSKDTITTQQSAKIKTKSPSKLGRPAPASVKQARAAKSSSNTTLKSMKPTRQDDDIGCDSGNVSNNKEKESSSKSLRNTSAEGTVSVAASLDNTEVSSTENVIDSNPCVTGKSMLTQNNVQKSNDEDDRMSIMSDVPLMQQLKTWNRRKNKKAAIREHQTKIKPHQDKVIKIQEDTHQDQNVRAEGVDGMEELPAFGKEDLEDANAFFACLQDGKRKVNRFQDRIRRKVPLINQEKKKGLDNSDGDEDDDIQIIEEISKTTPADTDPIHITFNKKTAGSTSASAQKPSTSAETELKIINCRSTAVNKRQDLPVMPQPLATATAPLVPNSEDKEELPEQLAVTDSQSIFSHQLGSVSNLDKVQQDAHNCGTKSDNSRKRICTAKAPPPPPIISKVVSMSEKSKSVVANERPTSPTPPPTKIRKLPTHEDGKNVNERNQSDLKAKKPIQPSDDADPLPKSSNATGNTVSNENQTDATKSRKDFFDPREDAVQIRQKALPKVTKELTKSLLQKKPPELPKTNHVPTTSPKQLQGNGGVGAKLSKSVVDDPKNIIPIHKESPMGPLDFNFLDENAGRPSNSRTTNPRTYKSNPNINKTSPQTNVVLENGEFRVTPKPASTQRLVEPTASPNYTRDRNVSGNVIRNTQEKSRDVDPRQKPPNNASIPLDPRLRSSESSAEHRNKEPEVVVPQPVPPPPAVTDPRQKTFVTASTPLPTDPSLRSKQTRTTDTEHLNKDSETGTSPRYSSPPRDPRLRGREQDSVQSTSVPGSSSTWKRGDGAVAKTSSSMEVSDNNQRNNQRQRLSSPPNADQDRDQTIRNPNPESGFSEINSSLKDADNFSNRDESQERNTSDRGEIERHRSRSRSGSNPRPDRFSKANKHWNHPRPPSDNFRGRGRGGPTHHWRGRGGFRGNHRGRGHGGGDREDRGRYFHRDDRDGRDFSYGGSNSRGPNGEGTHGSRIYPDECEGGGTSDCFSRDYHRVNSGSGGRRRSRSPNNNMRRSYSPTHPRYRARGRHRSPPNYTRRSRSPVRSRSPSPSPNYRPHSPWENEWE